MRNRFATLFCLNLLFHFIFANGTCRGIEVPKDLRKEGKNAAMKGVDKMIVFSDFNHAGNEVIVEDE